MTRLFSALPTSAQDVALLVARFLLGGILIAHGWQKFNEYTLAGTAASFDQMGIPAPRVTATAAALIELGGGVLLVAGLLTSIASALVVLNMIGAYWFVHMGSGVFVTANGFELVGAIGAGALVLGAVGAGRLSVDGLVTAKRTGTATRKVSDLV